MARRLIGSILKPSRLRRNYASLTLSGDKLFAASFSTSRSHFFAAGEDGHSLVVKAEERLNKFADPEVQKLLHDLTGMDYQKVFRNRKIGQKLTLPKYSFMTEAELEESVKEANEKAKEMLRMPPVLPPRNPIDEIISYDPILQGLEKEGVTLIFTDISPNISDLDRLIVARESDGTLRRATWDEREKMNKIYFPTPSKSFKTPVMLTDPKILQQVLSRASPDDNVYEFVLDRACLQLEPNDPLYISVAETTYETINNLKHYDYLKSTRHYGPMVFYLVRLHRMDQLLIHSIKEERISDASSLVSLFHLIFPECKSVQLKITDDLQKVSNYIDVDAVLKSELSLHLNAYKEKQKSRTDLEHGLERAHGLQ